MRVWPIATKACMTMTEDTPEGLRADTSGMLRVHAMFRREFGLLPALISGVPPGDRERTAVVADHIEFMCTLLHAHHTLEDEFLWPKLKSRGAEEEVAISLVMETQHSDMAQIIDQLNEQLPEWRRSAGTHALLQTAERLLPALLEHISVEESRALPMVEKHVTAAEWQRMAEVGCGHVPPENLPLVVGMMTYAGLESAAQTPLSYFERFALRAFVFYSERVHGPDSHGIKRCLVS